MEPHQWWRIKVSLKNVTLGISILNALLVLVLLHQLLTSASSRYHKSARYIRSAELRYMKECDHVRLAMLPLNLIKRVKEINEEGRVDLEAVSQKDTKQAGTAGDLSKRLKDFRQLNDSSSSKALEEWRKRKMERARQRESIKNGT